MQSFIYVLTISASPLSSTNSHEIDARAKLFQGLLIAIDNTFFDKLYKSQQL